MMSENDLQSTLLLKSDYGFPLIANAADTIQTEDHALLSAKTNQFLQSIGITPQELEEAGITDLLILDQALNRRCSNKILKLLAFDSVFAKILMYPFLDQNALNPEGLKKSGCKNWCKTRAWPHAASLPFKSKESLKRAFGVTAFTENVESMIASLWSGLIFSFVMADLYDYYKYPDERYDTTLYKIFLSSSSKEKSLTRSLTSYYVWPELTGIPLLWGIIQAIRSRSKSKELTAAEIESLIQTLENYQPNFFQDVLAWILPINPLQDKLDLIRRSLLWDNRLSHGDRRNLFNALFGFVQRAEKLTQQKGMQVLLSLADGVAKRDITLL